MVIQVFSQVFLFQPMRRGFHLAKRGVHFQSAVLYSESRTMFRKLGCAGSLRIVLAALAIFLGLEHGAAAQQIDPVPQIGTIPFQSYDGGDIDSINLATGSVSLHIPLVSFPQRGGKLHLNYFVNYTSPSFSEQTNCVTVGDCFQSWSGGCFSALCVVAGPSVYIGSDVMPTLRQTDVNNAGDCTVAPCYSAAVYDPSDSSLHRMGYITDLSLRSIDNSGYSATFTSLGGNSTLIDREGVQYNCSTPNSETGASSCTATDPNGNQLTLESNSNIVDSMGRTITSLNFGGIAYSTSPVSTQWTVPGPDGGSVTYTISCVGMDNDSCIITSIILPDQTSYSFQYQSLSLPLLTKQTQAQTFLVLSEVVLPSGGSISYNYSLEYGICGGSNSLICPVITSRTINANDGNGPQTWTYNINGYFSSPNSPTTVTDPLGNKTSHVYGITGFPYETQTQQFNSSGTLIKTVSTTYSYINYGADVFYGVEPRSITTIWPNGQQKQVSYTYDRDLGVSFSAGSNVALNPELNSYGSVQNNVGLANGYTSNPWTVVETDYGSGTPGPALRTTHTAYEAFVNSNYLNENLLDLKSSVQIQNGSGTQLAYTTYGYDAYALTPSDVASLGPAIAHPGNQTSVNHWLDTSAAATANCAVSIGSGGYAVSYATYYNTGMTYQATDACGTAAGAASHTTTYQYSSTYDGAFPTMVTNPLGQKTNYQYDFNTGIATSAQDPNGNTTSKQLDLMGRVTMVSYPDGGQTTYCYTDMGGPTCTKSDTPPYSVVTTEKMNSSLSMTSTKITDGLDRTLHTQLNSDPFGTVYTDTTYDGLGRIHTVSNPYRSTSDQTYGQTTYTYDALNRKTTQLDSDGVNTQTWSYSGGTVTYTDENGNQWQRTSDGLGRLTKVLEPNGASPSPTMETDYSYDGLNDLLSVTQWGGASGSSGARTRSFTYDSLSRLIQAFNPETGWVCYGTTPSNAAANGSNCTEGYDANGNLTAKTDARGVNIAYAYDALNRLTKKSYSDGVTPTSLFVYDSENITFGTPNFPTQRFTTSNVIGRLSVICVNIPGACQSMTAYSYDPMGRTVETLTNTPTFPTTGAVYTVSAQYDLAGNRTSTSNSTGRTFNYTYDTAGHLQTASNTATLSGTAVTTSMISSMTYFPSGQPQSMTTDTGAATTTGTWGVDKRLRVTSYQNLSTANSGNTNYGYSLTYTPNSNVKTDSETVYNPASGAKSWSWNFNYDTLNRLSSATSSGAIQFGCAETYDAFGNRINQQPSGTGFTCTSINTPVNVKNQLSSPPYTYDAAGNLLYDGTNTLTYDGEGRIITGNGTFGTTTYEYGADGQRVNKTFDSFQTEYIRDPDGSLLATYVNGSYFGNFQDMWAGGRHFGEAVVASGNASQTQNFALTNLLGSQVAYTNPSTGVPTAAYLSLPFGDAQTNLFGSNNDDIRFTGKEHDGESGNDYFGARYYASSMGRWMSPDWNALPAPVPFADLTNPQSLNLYAYVRNNPLSSVDADGHDCAYLNNSGTSAESVDHNSNAGDCKANGGAWADGYFDKSDVITQKNSDQVLIGSNLAVTPNGVTGNLTVGTPGQASNTSGSAIKDFLSRGPDFVQFSVSVGIPQLANLAGPTGSLTLDRNANVYLGLGVAVGKTLTFVSGSLTANSLVMRNQPTAGQLNSFITGNSFNFTAGFWGGVQGGWTPGAGYSVGVGVVSPQVGFAWTYGWKLGTVGSNGGW